MVAFGSNSVLTLGGVNLYWDGSNWLAQPAVPDVFGTLDDIEASGPCNATAVGNGSPMRSGR